jgi:hypothetical protein
MILITNEVALRSDVHFRLRKKPDQRGQIGVAQLLLERRHLAFDAVGDDRSDPLIGFGQAMEIGTFITGSVIGMAMGTIQSEEFRAS